MAIASLRGSAGQTVKASLGGMSGQADAFGRLRVSEPYTLYDAKMLYDSDPLAVDTLTTAGASVGSVGSTAMLPMIITASADRCIRQSRRYLPYQPGKSQMALVTFCLFPAGYTTDSVATVVRRVGLFDDVADKTATSAEQSGNGYFLQTTSYPGDAAYAIAFVRRSYVSGSQVDTTVARAAWNLDPMDGSGPSGVTLDLTKSQILFIDQEWLGVGTVRMGFVVNGVLYYCHAWHHANLIATMHTQSASMPVRYEIRNPGVGASTSRMLQGCATVASEGGHNPRGRVFSASNATGLAVANGVLRPIISIRPRPAQGRTGLYPLAVEVYLEGTTDRVEYEIVKSVPTAAPVTYTAASFADYAASYSGAQVDTAATAGTGGVVVAGGYVAQTQRVGFADLADEVVIATDITGVPETLMLRAKGVGTTATMRASIQWREII